MLRYREWNDLTVAIEIMKVQLRMMFIWKLMAMEQEEQHSLRI